MTVFTEIFDLATIRDRDVVVTLRPSVGERAGIAEWLGAMAVETFEAEITLSREGEDLYRYQARFTAEVVQPCVVTLVPVHSRLEGEFHRLYEIEDASVARAKARRNAAQGGVISLSDEEGPEPIDTTLVDLAAPVLEELSLALDPYPRAPGVVFEAPKEETSPADHPFAALEGLKSRLSAGKQTPQAPETGRRPRKPER